MSTFPLPHVLNSIIQSFSYCFYFSLKHLSLEVSGERTISLNVCSWSCKYFRFIIKLEMLKCTLLTFIKQRQRQRALVYKTREAPCSSSSKHPSGSLSARALNLPGPDQAGVRAPQCWPGCNRSWGCSFSTRQLKEGREGGKSERTARYRIITASIVNSLLNLFFCICKETSLNVSETIGDIFIS